MVNHLTVSVGQYSDKGRKEINQDFHGAFIPSEPQLSAKGVVIALADGISSSAVSQVASAAAVKGFLEDYYCTSEAWSVKKSAQSVLVATNSWLYSQTKQSQYRYDKEKGYVCTLSAIVIKSTTAHLFHVGDSRIYRLRNNVLEQLTEDHRFWVSAEQSYLSRALGMTAQLDIDCQSIQVEAGDIFLLATDGVYEFAKPAFIMDAIKAPDADLDLAAKSIVAEAYQQGSQDNLTAQIIRIDSLPNKDADELYQELTALPFPPMLEPRMMFDGYKIIRQIHASHRSHVYLALDIETNTQTVIKTPSIDQRHDAAYLERFLMEEWIAKRIDNAHVLKPSLQTRKRNYLYVATEFIDGQTLAQWIIDNPKPDLATVRGIVEQIAKGLHAFHRLEMLHQDIRPNNIMIDNTGTVKIIDFGSTRVAGLREMATPITQHHLLGTALYAAPECFLGEESSPRSDIFSLGVLTYHLFTGRFPYGVEMAKCKTSTAQFNLEYDTMRYDRPEIPVWVDDAIKKSLHPNPHKRYEDLSEFIYDLRHPNKAFLSKSRPPLLERNPVKFWKGLSLMLALTVVVLLYKLQ